jgi:hypothetical protein
MKRRPVDPEKVLNQLLRFLLKNWGAKTVVVTLEKLLSVADRNRYFRADRREVNALSPTELVRDLEITGGKRTILLDLAAMFEAKDFLPTSSDVRNFLKRRGVEPSKSTTRAQQFRPLLPVLSQMSEESLEKLKRQGARSGVADLGPISDAIREVGASRHEASTGGDEVRSAVKYPAGPFRLESR